MFGLATPIALNLFALAFLLAALAIGLALLAFVRIWQSGIGGAGAAISGVLLAMALLAWPAIYAPMALSEPPLNDITTDFDDPPELTIAINTRPPGAQDAEYPGASAATLQRSLYPDIQPIVVQRPAAETYELVLQALRKLGMEIVREEEPTRGAPGMVEAVDRTLVIGFRDDVAVRITGRPGKAKIDIRSASRWGESDFGRNAQRTRAIVREILRRLQSTVPAAEQG